VIDPKSGEPKTLSLSAECKGLLAGDNRHYLFELARLAPSDPFFCEHPEGYPHDVCFFRRELVEAYWTSEGVEGRSFEFNPDTHVSYLPNPPKEDIESLMKLSAYLRNTVIPEVALKLCSATSSPYDGIQLTHLMHEHGINMRYINYLLQHVISLPFSTNQAWAKGLIEQEIRVRAAKHVIRTYMNGDDNVYKICHLLNCAFGEASLGGEQVCSFFGTIRGIIDHI